MILIKNPSIGKIWGGVYHFHFIVETPPGIYIYIYIIYIYDIRYNTLTFTYPKNGWGFVGFVSCDTTTNPSISR